MVDFARIDPVDRASDIRRGGAGARPAVDRAADSVHANAAAIAAIESLEARLRRRDLLVGRGGIVEFFLERIPAQVTDLRTFQRWWRERESLEPDLLDLPRNRLLARPVPAFSATDFPDRLEVGGNPLELRYVFDPLAEDDGLTLVLPLPAAARAATATDRETRARIAAREGDRDPARAAEGAAPLARADPDAADRFLANADEGADSALTARLATFVTAQSGTPVAPRDDKCGGPATLAAV
jgi:ATP-dependent helicase HrpA